MNVSNDKTEDDKKHNNDATDTKQFLINNEKFQLLIEFQKEVYEKTEITPSRRKIINELITEENLNKIKSKFIENWK
jgi:hypothetical protein